MKTLQIAILPCKSSKNGGFPMHYTVNVERFMKPSFLTCIIAAAVAPLIIPFTSGWVFFLLHEWLEPSVWGLPPLQSLIGVSINCTLVGYVFTWFYGLPLALVLQWINRYRISALLLASSLPALSLPFWQTGWTISILPAFLAGTSTAYLFWFMTQWNKDGDSAGIATLR
ncbi:MAG: hypothetical protein ACXV8P_11500, partial [Methylobacter sp.]